MRKLAWILASFLLVLCRPYKHSYRNLGGSDVAIAATFPLGELSDLGTNGLVDRYFYDLDILPADANHPIRIAIAAGEENSEMPGNIAVYIMEPSF